MTINGVSTEWSRGQGVTGNWSFHDNGPVMATFKNSSEKERTQACTQQWRKLHYHKKLNRKKGVVHCHSIAETCQQNCRNAVKIV